MFFGKTVFLSHEIKYIDKSVLTVQNVKPKKHTYELFTMEENKVLITTFRKPEWRFLVPPTNTVSRKQNGDRHSCEWEYSAT